MLASTAFSRVIVAADSARAARSGVAAAVAACGPALRSVTLLAVLPQASPFIGFVTIPTAHLREEGARDVCDACTTAAYRVPDTVDVVHHVADTRLERAVADLCRENDYDLVILPYRGWFPTVGGALRTLRLMRCGVATLTVPFAPGSRAAATEEE